MSAGPDTRPRVLLVEDEALIAMLMEDMLTELGCQVTTAGELGEAVALANTGAFDLAFIDVNLRGVPAWPLADALRARGIPFAFVTGYGTAGPAGAKAGEPVLSKPFQLRDVEAVLRQLRQSPAG